MNNQLKKHEDRYIHINKSAIRLIFLYAISMYLIYCQFWLAAKIEGSFDTAELYGHPIPLVIMIGYSVSFTLLIIGLFVAPFIAAKMEWWNR